jgi:hypothetical protein
LVEIVLGKIERYKIRAADAKEVGVGNPAEETCCYPNEIECDVFATLCQSSCRNRTRLDGRIPSAGHFLLLLT